MLGSAKVKIGSVHANNRAYKVGEIVTLPVSEIARLQSLGVLEGEPDKVQLELSRRAEATPPSLIGVRAL